VFEPTEEKHKNKPTEKEAFFLSSAEPSAAYFASESKRKKSKTERKSKNRRT